MSKWRDQRFPVNRNLPRGRTLLAASLVSVLVIILVSYSCLGLEASGSKLPVWSLTWRDEFAGPNGSPVDSAKWSFDIGGNGWGNNELQTYTNRTANAALQDGALVIRALKETSTGPDNITRDYTSARLVTRDKFSQTYGRFEARIKIPYGQGIWPAFWLLGDDLATAGWPRCGEIDIMENIGKEPSIVHGTLHGPGYSAGKGLSASYALPASHKFSDDYHTYAIEWEPNVIRFYVDGSLYKTRTPADLPTGKPWVFHHRFFLILNVAVGGNWPGNPDATTVFPQQMLVDYVRVYQRSTRSIGGTQSISPVWIVDTRRQKT
jgi:beta-glucanase (GH16 family)